jgi:hypothetical protein
VDPHARPPARGRSRPPRGAPARRHARARTGARRRRRRRGGVAAPPAGARQAAPDSCRTAAGGARACHYGGARPELAERLGSPSFIKSRMFMGLAGLRELLGDPGLEISWTSTT